MRTKPYLIVTAQGKYHAYLINDVTSAVTDSGLNIVAVEQNSSFGLAILAMVTETIEPDDSVYAARERLLKKFGKLINHQVDVKIIPPGEISRFVNKNIQVFTIIGRDKVGILKAITNALANFRVSIEKMHHIARGELVVMELWVDASELRDLAVLKDAIQQTCKRFNFDTIIQPDSPFRQRRRLVVFDMDRTIIENEVIDELAKAANVGKKVSEITSKAMAGELEYKESLRARVKLLKGLSADLFHDVAQNMKLTHGAQDVTRTLKELGFKLALISGGFYYFANIVKERLGFDYVYANELEIKDGVVTGELKGPIIDAEAKGRILKEIAEKEGLTLDEVVAVGDGSNDEIMLKNAGFGIAFNAHDILKKVADGQLTQKNLHGLLFCLGATGQNQIPDTASAS
ncbi:MAG: phosphoserine phosphatase SerB [Calditrichaeota bacterium]|nr:MAG: phosphoserine phosphatase SerB [Calditrichota bacterium]